VNLSHIMQDNCKATEVDIDECMKLAN